eukprot:842971-Alexandrium_andersonii.AAC.1
MSDLQPWLPDQNSHCDCLCPLSAAEVGQRFGVSPAMVSCWACLVNTMTPQQQRWALSDELEYMQ